MLKAEIKALEDEAGLAVEAAPSPRRKQAMTEVTCFKAYDIRGEIGVNIDEAVAIPHWTSCRAAFQSKICSDWV